jgi:hypothetical protein
MATERFKRRDQILAHERGLAGSSDTRQEDTRADTFFEHSRVEQLPGQLRCGGGQLS